MRSFIAVGPADICQGLRPPAGKVIRPEANPRASGTSLKPLAAEALKTNPMEQTEQTLINQTLMKTMTKEQLAQRLDGREYREEMTKEEEKSAKENNLLVLFGQSDDLLEMRGAIRDETGAWEGGDYALALKGELYADGEEGNTCHKALENEVLPISDEHDNDDDPRLIRVEWDPEPGPDDPARSSWRITSNLPCAPFTIREDGDPYCEGIVIDLDEVPARKDLCD